ncbi:MAG: rRNA maturation RNase YbeY [Dysgonamonadaceae bacterium]|jgi:rRNA maturation RNase YbeY|nr:rRNA maturation RNase YbeY [Dysgonamonadaceae bacterium]
MAILFSELGISSPKLKRTVIKQWIFSVINTFGKKTGNITYVFCSDEEILRINNQYLKHDYYTDIITFDYSEKDLVSGDLFISLDTVKSNSEKFATKFNDELYRVMIHGILHLCGLNDKSAKQQATMRENEDEALKHLKTLIEPS